MQPSIPSYLAFLFTPFFRNWWAALTGCASILALFVTPTSGVTFNGPGIMTVTFALLLMIFVTLSVCTQGWGLYSGRLRGMRVTEFERNRDVEEGWVFVIDGDVDLAVGAVVDVHKKTGAAEVPLALAQVMSRRATGGYQAVPIGKLNPAHIQEHSAGGIKPLDLIVHTNIRLHRLREVASEFK